MTRFPWILIAITLTLCAAFVEAQEEGTVFHINPHTPNIEHDHRIIIDPVTGAVYDVAAIHAANRERLRQAGLISKQAIAFLVKKQPDKAVPLLKQVLELDPTARFFLADVYIAQKRPNDVLQTLQPIVYPPTNPPSGVGEELVAEMKYVLALLDVGKWEEAVSTYEMSLRLQEKNGRMPIPWAVPCYSEGSGDKVHTLANVHFSSAVFDAPGLRRQAHLILGTRQTGFLPELTIGDAQKPEYRYMLGHLQQAIQSDRRCLDAHFLSGVILSELDRFAEGRQAFAKAALLAPREAQPEIKAAVDKLNAREASKKLYDADHPENANLPSPAIGVKATSSKTSDQSNEQGAQSGRAF